MDPHGTGRYWDDFADAYDAQPGHALTAPATATAWRDLLQRWLPEAPARVAELGCGTGALTALVAELGHEVDALDLAGAMVARARAATAHYGDRVRILQADVAVPPLPPGSLDAVLARHILWTLPDPQTALRRWTELLRDGGRLLLVEGRWTSVGDQAYASGRALPWPEGAPEGDLREAVAPLMERVDVVPLDDPRLWGGEVHGERYLLVGQRP